MQGTIVGVLRGGPSREHEISLASGGSVLSNLSTDHYIVRDIFIDKQGIWHERGLATTPDKVLQKLDVVVNMLHGKFGHDGTVQRILEQYGVPYTGADPWGAFLSSHKVMAKEKAKELGIRTAEYRFVEAPEQAESIVADVIRSFHQPVVVKPVSSGSSVGVSLVGGYAPVYRAVMQLFAEGEQGVLIEQRIKGVEATAGVVEGLRGERLYRLPPIEIVPPQSHTFFSYDAKYSGETQEIVPGRFPHVVSEKIMDAAVQMHDALGLRHYSRSDFIVADGEPYFLETNNSAAVGFAPESLLPKSLAAVGVAFPDFLTHLVNLALVHA